MPKVLRPKRTGVGSGRRWTHDEIIGPLLEHVQGWTLMRRPHLMLIPLGDLAAVPYAAAWKDDETQPTGRRYAIQDVVISYIASARLLLEVAARDQLPLLNDVEIVGDATGEFHFSRRAAVSVYQKYGAAKHRRLLGRRDNPRREPVVVAATTQRILRAMLGGSAEDGTGGDGTDEAPASLLHLATHGTMHPQPRLQTADGWLSLDHVLELGWARAPAAPGGLLITTACLSDSTSGSQDEALTLATALLTAFATGVTGTRWPIDDENNAEFVLHLHDQLSGGATAADALRTAQVAMLEAGWPPAAWAGYVHHGC